MNEIKSTKGITLVALVVTIIILLILAGVTIATLTGENGLLEKAKESKTKTEIASIKEQIQIDIIEKQSENNGNISDDSLKEILEKYGTLSEEEKLTDKTLTTKENYEIKVSDIWNGTTKEDGPKDPTFTTVANEPDINGFNKSNTYYVSWDLSNSPYTIDDATLISGTAPSNWYDYTAGVNKWANIKTTGGGNASTTGNVYGIYDMAGGAGEYVAGIYTGGASNDNRSKLWDSNNSKYVDKYTNTTGAQSTYYGNTDKYGDAVYETSSSGYSLSGSWGSSFSCFPYSSYPVFLRGGHAVDGSCAGVFAFYYLTGEAYTTYSFRAVVLSSQP